MSRAGQITGRVDLVVENGRIVTMDAERSTFDGWVAVDGGTIVAMGEGDAVGVRAAHRIDAHSGLVRPGYIDSHRHSMDVLARGGDSGPVPFSDWLFGTYYGTVLRLEPADAARSASLVATDLLLSGTTTVVDCWGVGDVGSSRAAECLDATLEVADRSGIRWIVAPMVGDRLPERWHADLDRVELADDRFRRSGMAVATDVAIEFVTGAFEGARGTRLVEVWAAPEVPEMATDELLDHLVEITRREGAAMTTHLLASPPDPTDPIGHDAASLGRLVRHGACDPHLLAAHVSFASSDDLRTLAARASGVAHCPSATMMLGGDRSVAGAARNAGVAVGLGTDNPSLNSLGDMPSEMRQALMFDRAGGVGQPSLDADAVVAFATCDGARAIGRDDVGTIEVGRSADLVVVDRSGPHWEPRREPVAGLCFQERAGDVRDVVVAGRHLVTDGEIRSLR
ncbi:MAG: amidohydrolase family protein [Actinomycetota bacterium]